MATRSSRRAFTLVELLVVVFILAILVSILLPALSRARKSSLASKLSRESSYGSGQQMLADNFKASADPQRPVQRPQARVKSLEANIALTPRLSVGTAEPESIYEARFVAKVLAASPAKDAGDCEIQLPLPPQIISLADLSVTANGEPSDMVALRDGKLVWRGAIAADPVTLQFTYTAVGKGLYALEIPPGGIVEAFNTTLVANGSDVRMLELSLQPTSLGRSGGVTTYTWNYKRLMFGRPICLDVLGIAPIDRLGELSWLGPASVIVFGMLVGLVAHAFQVKNFDRWMLLLVLGTFTGAYPLMYFAQEFISLQSAILASAGVVLLIISIRTITIMGAGLAIGGVVLPAAAIMAITLLAAVQTNLQGILLTAEALGFFILAMLLLPRLKLPEPKAAGPSPEPRAQAA